MNKTRFLFSKTGVAKYSSHLDLMRVLRRAFARADIELVHSEGFNPHPYLSVALPLPVGVESVCELLDVRLVQEPKEEMIAQLNAALPPGLAFQAVAPLRAVSEIAYAGYAFAIAQPPDDWNLLRELFYRDPVSVSKKTKSGVAEIDIRPHVKQWEAEQGGRVCRALLRAADPAVSPGLFCRAMQERFPQFGWAHAVCTRTGLYDEAMERY